MVARRDAEGIAVRGDGRRRILGFGTAERSGKGLSLGDELSALMPVLKMRRKVVSTRKSLAPSAVVLEAPDVVGQARWHARGERILDHRRNGCGAADRVEVPGAPECVN